MHHEPVASESPCFSPWWQAWLDASLGTQPPVDITPPWFLDSLLALEDSQLQVHQQTFTEHLLSASPAQVHCKDECWGHNLLGK